MKQPDLTLRWEPQNIAKIMSENNIQNRQDLAGRLEQIGLSRATVYRAFTDDWQGRATIPLLTALSIFFAVPIALLHVDPRG